MKTNKFWSDFWPEICTSLLILMVFLISVDVYQYLTTEVWWLLDEINNAYASIYFLVLVLIFSFIPLKKWLLKSPVFIYLILCFFFITLFAHRKYTLFYNETQQYPKVREVSKNWGIPGSWIKITGTNFGEESEPGNVFLGDKKMLIKKWSDKEIIFEINMEAGKGNHSLKILNNKDKQQKQTYNFEIK